MSIDLAEDKATVECTRYWDFWFREPALHARKDEYIEELDRLFYQAVNRQLISDVEVGAYLSGGIDSGSITAVAATRFQMIKTFTCGFDLSSASGMELAFDERVRAEAMSARFKTEQYELVLKAGDMERCLPELTWHLEEPRVGQSYPNYYIAKLAGKFVKVVMSGAGEDAFVATRGAITVLQPAKTLINMLINIMRFGSASFQIVRSQLFAPIWPDVSDVWTRDIFKNVF